MTEIKIKSEHASTKAVFYEAIKTEENRIGYALQLGGKRLGFFEKKYGVSSETFLQDWTAEKLEGKDVEYVEWAGEAKLYSRMRERLAILQGIKYAYQYQDRDGNLIFRYDNAAHKPKLDSVNHKHSSAGIEMVNPPEMSELVDEVIAYI